MWKWRLALSGESGAGKTESTKLLLQHIMNLCKGNSQLEQQILQVNPLLEAFGNAQTVMNDNSSRFGKYIQLRFQQNTVRGAKLSEYLLEKSRVVQQDAGERNFHIFYYMFAGLSSEEKEMYGLLDPSLYRYISGRFGTQDVAQRWKHKYQEVCNALDMVGFQEQEQVDMQAILAGVLSLGNVTFEPEESSGCVKVSETSRGWLKAAAVNPLLEAFGNAQTVMNDNSSRFGKYIQLRFQQNTVRGAKLSEYLLEKSRVVQQDAGERNFHIFYYMFAGLSSEEKEMYGLLDPSLYRYISGRFGTQDVAQRWKHKYQEVCNALDMVGFQEQEQVDMQAILAGVLSLGNVTFEPEESSGCVKVSETSRGWLKAAAGQFGVQEDELLKCLICTMSVTRGEQIQRFHTQQQAEDARDSIAKVAYGRVFGWIVCKINELLAENVDPEVELREIGILDIFGFENFAVNRFEQLCINLANEQLQHFFNHLEQAAYKEEELPWETITFNNNEPILNLLLAKPLGLLSLLDEQSAFPQATDKTFVDKLNSSFKGNLHFQPGRGRVLGFSIIHYAGKVQYTAGGFLEKNRDTLPANVRGLFINSVTPLLSVLFTEVDKVVHTENRVL
nr:PREDICTED: myosin-IIIb-like [Opisthocomus hoazin]